MLLKVNIAICCRSPKKLLGVSVALAVAAIVGVKIAKTSRQ